MTTTRNVQGMNRGPVLHLAFELGLEQWKVAFTIGLGQAPRVRSVMARDQAGVVREIALAKGRFGLPDDALVVSCYEAGRDGFWLHRWLTTVGVTNYVVYSSSIEVNRKKRRAKSDQLDAEALVRLLVRLQGQLGDSHRHGQSRHRVCTPESPGANGHCDGRRTCFQD